MNTDDYEGHTPAPWVNEYDEELGEHTIESGDGMVAQRVLGVDADLIAAAPDLLAEVERLREVIDKVKDTALGYVKLAVHQTKQGRKEMADYMLESIFKEMK